MEGYWHPCNDSVVALLNMSPAAWHLRLDVVLKLSFLQGLHRASSGFHPPKYLSNPFDVLSPMIHDCAMTQKKCTALKVPLCCDTRHQMCFLNGLPFPQWEYLFPNISGFPTWTCLVMFGCLRGDLWHIHCIFRSPGGPIHPGPCHNDSLRSIAEVKTAVKLSADAQKAMMMQLNSRKVQNLGYTERLKGNGSAIWKKWGSDGETTEAGKH